MKRTTILADEGLMLEARRLAEESGRSVTAIIHEALAEYLTRHRPQSKPISFIGIGRSGRGDIAERAEEILAADIDRETGWSH